MSKNRFLRWIILFILTASMTKMNAQENKTNQNLNAEEQSLVKISSLTATGNLESLKLQLKTGLDCVLTINEIKEALV